MTNTTSQEDLIRFAQTLSSERPIMRLSKFLRHVIQKISVPALLFAAVLGINTANATGPSTEVSVQADSALITQAGKRWTALGFDAKQVSVNGATLYVAESGKGEPLILLHGYPQSGEVWRYVAPELAKTYHVIVPDLRGMGLSEIASGYDLSTVAEDIHALVRSMGLTKVKVVGHDWGGSVGAVYALRYRDEVTQLAFLESALPGAGFEELWNFSKPNPGFTFIPFLLLGGSDREGDTTADFIKGRESMFLHHLWATFTGDKKAAPFSNWAPYIAELARPGISIAGASYYREAYVSAAQVRTLVVHKLKIPVLSIAGEKGIGKNQEALVRRFADNITDIIVIPSAGHFLAEERPSEVTEALEKFLSLKDSE